MTPVYYFGRVPTVRIDYFAFPRCGSHFLRSCTAGLFDLVALPHPDSASVEAAGRRDELDPLALYALDLREDGVGHHPVWFNATANGQHGTPVMGGHPVVILIREPRAAVYSLFRVSRDRWNVPIANVRAWAAQQFERYGAFYGAANDVLAANPSRAILLRYEDLRRDEAVLGALIAFVGVRPKLSPAFVHRVTRFENFARPGERTFYREADNDAWSRDAEWTAAVRGLALPDFAAFGYGER